MWYGAYRNNVVAYEHGAWRPPGPQSLGESWVRTLYEDPRGRNWGGFDRGVARIDDDGSVREPPQPPCPADVRVIHQDRRGDLWFGTFGGGLICLHEGRLTRYMTPLGEYNNRAWCIHEDADGVFWIATRNGLNRFVPPGPAEARPPKSEGRSAPTPSTGILQPAIDNSNGRFFTFTTQHGLHENFINNIQEDGAGRLWFSGQQGIYCVARQELNAVAAGRQARAQVLAFGETDGLPNSQCNGGFNQHGGCQDDAGRIWFPTVRGVAMIDPRVTPRNEVPPPVVVERVKADAEVVYGDGAPAGSLKPAGHNPKPATNVKLEPRGPQTAPLAAPLHLAAGRARVLELHYTANSFAAPNRVRFKYRLEGYDRTWHADDENRRVTFYTSLPPGTYSFLVAACNNHGVWSTTPAGLSFTLAPHFWQTWLFRVLAGTALVGTVAAVQAYRLRWQRRVLRAEQRQALADERTRIARDLHDDLGTALTGTALKLDLLRRETAGGPRLGTHLAESAALIRGLAERMREVVWAVNPRCDTVSSLAGFLEQQAGHFLKTDGLRCRFEFPEDIPALPLDGDTRYQLALGVRKALSNAVRHAAASEIALTLSIGIDRLTIRVADNGRGFRVEECVQPGHGLANVAARLEKLGGRFECRSAPGEGTIIALEVPIGRREKPPGTVAT